MFALFKFSILLSCLLKLYVSHSFNEELFVESLPDSHIHFYFQFTSTDQNLSDLDKISNYVLIPKQLGDLVNKFEIDEFHLSLTQGTWKYNSWGLPSNDVPTGGELWSLFKPSLPSNLVDSYWLKSTRAVSGLFGLSINLEDSPNTVQPKSFFKSLNVSNLRYALVPNEIVCTENLTPWIKLLPCVKNKGLAQLLKNPHKLFESQYFSIGLKFKKVCKSAECTTYDYELRQTLSVVYNAELYKKQMLNDQPVLSLLTIFSQKVDSICPIADISNVYMDLGSNAVINVEPDSKLNSKEVNREIYVFDLRKRFSQNAKEFNPTITVKKSTFALKPYVSIHRYITDSNERNFGLKTVIKNNLDKNITITYFDSVPWYFRLFANSLKVKKNDEVDIRPDSIYFSPGLDYKRPHHIELSLTIEPNSVNSIYFKNQNAYLKWDEYPPDVNHGFYLNPALVSVYIQNEHTWSQLRLFSEYKSIFDRLNSDRKSTSTHRTINLYSETLLMNLPTPDFSMPYNVICLTCTVIAIAFGSIHNFTTRKFIFQESKTFKENVQQKLKKLFGK